MKILIAIDDHHYADLLADFIEQHSWADNSVFRVIHVLWAPREQSASAALREAVEQDMERATELMTDMCQRLSQKFPKCQFESLILEGKPAERILEMSKAWPADVLIVGNRARRGLPLFFLGSVSSALVHAASCSVFVVKDKQALEKSTKSTANKKADKALTKTLN